MTQSSEPWQRFEELVRRILEANGFAMTRHSPRGDGGFDFVGLLDGEHWAIEIKYYRTSRAQAHLIEAAATRVVHRGSGTRQYRGMLV